MSQQAFDEIFEQLKSNVRLSIQGMAQASPEGAVTLTLPELGVIMLATCFAVALNLGATPEQLRTVAARCLHDSDEHKVTEDPAKKIILS